MSKRGRAADDAVFAIGKPKKAAVAPRAPKATRSTVTGHGQPVRRAIDVDTRRKILQARLDALEASNPGDEVPRTGHEPHPLADFLGLTGRGGLGSSGNKKSAARTGMRYTGLSLTQIVAAESGQPPVGGTGGLEDAVDLRLVLRDDAVDTDSRQIDSGRPASAYLAAAAGPSRIPPRPLCAVCGFTASGSCSRCGARCCSAHCQRHHTETRCITGGR
jgi:hypothetical protein